MNILGFEVKESAEIPKSFICIESETDATYYDTDTEKMYQFRKSSMSFRIFQTALKSIVQMEKDSDARNLAN